MKKNVLKVIGLFAVIAAFQSCEPDFLNEEPQGSTLTSVQLEDAIALNPDIALGTVSGLYTTMFQAGSGGSGGHDDFGQKAYDIFGDMLCGDMALSNSSFGWYRSSITEFQGTQDFTFGDNRQVWRYYYRMINNANLAIQGFGGDEADPENPDNRAGLGQVLASRAHSYFWLTQLMANDYAPDQPILPIYREPGITGNPKATTAEVYELMERDITRAIELLEGYNRPAKANINQSVAKAIKAYIIASTRSRWDEVAALTQQVLNESGTTLMSADDSTFGILGGFNDVSNPGWLWGVDLNADTGVGLLSWWGQVDFYSYSYAAVGDTKVMDQDLYDSMDASDVRRNQFFTTPGLNFLQPLFKQYDADRVPFGTSTIVKADYHYMRRAEIQLLNAEALARAGQMVPAAQSLTTLVSQRVDDASYISSLSQQELIDEIYKQTRLELWGEGKSYLAMKRNQATVTRGPNHLSFVGVPIAHNDERLTFEIPLDEIQNNPNINTQN